MLSPPAGGTTFAFIEFDDERDAEDSVRDRDGYKFDGQRLRVELVSLLFVTLTNLCAANRMQATVYAFFRVRLLVTNSSSFFLFLPPY